MKDVMKKAEELELAFQREVEKANLCCESCKQVMLKSRIAFEYGYKAALSTQTDKVQMLVKGVYELGQAMPPNAISMKLQKLLAAFSQKDEGV